MEPIRIDQWLWAARFFKTRALAKKALEQGKVRQDGGKIKASRLVQLDQVLTLTQGYDTKTVVVTGLSAKRGSATDAAKLYQETAESLNERELAGVKRKTAALATPVSHERPTKKQRRQIIRFKHISEVEQ